MKHCLSILSCFALAFFLAGNATAQLANLKFTTYTTENGLTDNYVVKTVTDKKGFLWIATRNGLSRLDGLQFNNYNLNSKPATGLRSSWITDLLVDDNGTLWASTEGGLCFYNSQADTFQYINPPNKMTVLYKAPMCLQKGYLWIALEEGLKKISTSEKTVFETALKRIPDPQCICSDDKNNIWVGTRGHGFYIYNSEKNNWKTCFFSALPKDAHLMGFYKDGATIWAATSEGLLEIYNDQSATLFNSIKDGILPTSVNALTFVTSFNSFTGDSLLLCGTYNKRLAVFHKHTQLFTEVFSGDANKLYTVPNSIFNNAQANNSLLWISTDKGLASLNMQEQNFTSYLLNDETGRMNKALIRKIILSPEKENTLFMLANNPAALIQYNSKTNAIEQTWFNKSSTSKYRALARDDKNALWLVREDGIDKFSPQSGITPEYQLKTDDIFSAAFDSAGILWLGTGKGLVKYNTVQHNAEMYDCHFNGTEIENSSYAYPFLTTDLFPDNKGKIWLASGKYGLFSFDINTKKFTPYRQPFSGLYETKNRLSGLKIDNSGQLWASTMAGITRFDTAKKTFDNFNQQNGLASSYIYAIGLADNSIVGRGNNGIVWYQTGTKKFINYSVPVQMSSGILDQRVSIINNKAYIGFEGGFTVYNLASSKVSKNLPVYITGCYLTNHRFPLPKDFATKPVDFNYQQNDLQIDFACVNFNEPENIRYRYQMSGASNDWTDVGKQRSLLFMNLPPGKYLFKVEAVDNDKNKSQQPAVFSFVIHPPFWNTVLFKTIAIVLLAGCILIIFYLRIKKIKQTEAQKTAVNKTIAELEMKALRSQMNPHFIFNSLNSIQKFIWENRQEDAAEYLTKFARLIRSILENSTHKLVPLQSEIGSIKLYLELEHRRSNQKFDYSIAFEENMNTAAIMIPPLLLQPYIENAIWHGLSTKKTHGQLNVTFSQVDKHIICIIDDDGIGRTASQAFKSSEHQSMGLNISHQRIDLMQKESGIHAEVEVLDKIDENGQATGTTVQLTLPLIIHHA